MSLAPHPQSPDTLLNLPQRTAQLPQQHRMIWPKIPPALWWRNPGLGRYFSTLNVLESHLGNFKSIPVAWAFPRPTESETLRVGPSLGSGAFKKLSR